jgi:type IV pilus assembly protein PilV
MSMSSVAANCRVAADARAQVPAQRGFTLVEALVALVVLSIGLLGVAKLVLGAVHADDSAYMRGQATQLAYELLDQMRANRPGAIAGFYALAGANHNCSGVACTPQQLAELDVVTWQNRLAQALPGGVGTVTMGVDALNDVTATIQVSWDDSVGQWSFGVGGVPAAMNLTLETIL